MASYDKGNTSPIPVIIIILFLVQILAPIFSPNIDNTDILVQTETSLSHPFVNENETSYGHDFAGNEISIDGLIDAKVRYESALDMWNSHIILNASNQTPGTPDVVFRGNQQIEMCWTTLQGQIRTLARNISGGETLMHVDDVAAYPTNDSVVDCALAVKKNGRKTLLYADGNDMKAAQIALQGSLYLSGDFWHTRTILENINATHIELEVSPSDLEWGVYRNDIGQLYQINYSGTLWETQLLDIGPVGVDIELNIDEYGEINILYSKASDVILMTINGSTTQSIVQTNSNLHSQLGLGFDDGGLVQISTSSFDGNNSTINLQRSLANNKNQIGSSPVSIIDGQWENSSSGEIFFADFNYDGFSDLVTSQPEVNTWKSASQSSIGSSNGQVSLYYGSQSGLTSVADVIYYGEQDNQNLGQGLTVGDFNNDGFSDLVIGSPGFNLNDGKLDFYFGSSTGLSLVPDVIPNVSNPSSSGLRYGSMLETISDLDGDEIDELLVSSPLYSQNSDTGQIEVFHGAQLNEDWGTLSSPTQNNQGSLFGRSISASGDINGDGFSDLVVGNTGTFSDTTGYSAVEIYYGTSNGFTSQSDYSLQSNLQGTLFGYEVEIISDINNDGFDEVFISEPYNGSNAYNSGMVWIFYGNASGLAGQPDLILTGEMNDLIGVNIISAGDINSDGFNDILMTHSGSSTSGTIELYLGSSSGLESQHYTVIGGGGNVGINGISLGDVNGDSIEDFVFSQEITNQSNSNLLRYYIHSRELWENKNFTVIGELSSLDLEISANGKTSILTSSSYQDSIITKLFDNAYDGTSSGQWLEHVMTDNNLNNTTSTLAVSSSGLPYVFMADGTNGVVLRTPKSMTALEAEVQTLGTSAQFIGHALDSSGKQHIAYSTSGNTQIYLNVETSSGWTFENIRSSISVTSPINVLTDSNNSSHLIYRNSNNGQLEYAFHLNGWNIETLGSAGQVASTAHSSVWLPNGDLAVGLIEYDGNDYNLTMWTWNGTVVNSSFVRSETDLSTDIKLQITDDGILIFAALTSSGILSLYEKAWNGTVWNGTLLDQPSGVNGDFSLELLGGNSPAMMVRSSSNSIYVRQGVESWISMANQPESMASGTWSLTQSDTHFILFTTNPDSGYLQWNSIEKTGIHANYAPWFSQSFRGISTTSNVYPLFDQNETLNVAVIEEIENKILSINLYIDSDRDLIFDKIDDLPYLSNQWSDFDEDGFGDNIFGPQVDSCPQENRTSSLILFGCNDYDNDGYADLIDTCNSMRGFSWLGRTGCGDFDQDGWSDNQVSYNSGDIFTNNWKQVFDSDGDGYGDNHGPDCCNTWYDANAQPGDAFPYDPKQYVDWDGDGYGDNTSDLVGGDRCRFEYGTSWRDRLGCLDSDFDGASDPGSGWTEIDGADLWPSDPTQWADSDGDGYGDNSSLSATNPDAFPNNIAAVNDTDGDGYPNNFTSFFNGTNANGLYMDGCPLIFGNSSNPLFGCQDSDGDDYMDLYIFDINATTGLRENQSGDAFPSIDTQWKDTDGDGFGDQQFGYQADVCPYQIGVINGTLGIGCRLIDNNDDDGDFVINDEDLCPNTVAGWMVDTLGCAQNQLDDDEDGVFNDEDLCDLTPIGEVVDSIGCSQVQKEVDDDGDGVYNFEDLCPDTNFIHVANPGSIDSNGCAPDQVDTDGDGVLDSNDDCPDTPLDYPVDESGCTDNAALNFDWDGDGYQGIYQYDYDETQSIRINQQGDYYPFESSQWWDTDGDGFGDNLLGINPDDCMLENGTSFEDRLGCLDTDDDGWSNPNQVDWFASPNGQGDAFIDDSTQWRDIDGDGYGDNQFGNNPDICPNTKSAYRESVDLSGCADNEKDTDNDGVVDSLDNCPDDAKGIGGYVDGCPLENLDGADRATRIFGMTILTFIILCVSALVGIVIAISFIRRSDDDEDWYDDEDDEDDEYQEEPLSFLSEMHTSRDATPSRGGPTETSLRNIPRGGGPPSGPIRDIPKGPNRGQESSIGATTSALSRSRMAPQKAKRMKSNESGEKKVRKAKLEVDMDILAEVDTADRDSAVEWVISSLSDDISERKILMQLQENGWNAPQSRAIINLGKNQ